MKTEGLKIGFGALGSSVRFKKDEIKRSDGTIEYYNTLYMLVRNPSIKQVVLLQRSNWHELNDIEKIEFDPRGVLRDVYSDEENFSPKNIRPKHGIKGDYQHSKSYQNLYNYLAKEDPFDFCIFFIGMGYMSNSSIPDFLRATNKPHNIVRIRWVTYMYSAPIVHFINQSKVPWFMIANDPRYTRKIFRMRDTMNIPKEIISQYNQKCTWESVNNYEDNYAKYDTEISKNIDMYYTGIEKVNLINTKLYPPDNERDTKFTIVAMQSTCAEGYINDDDRYKQLKEWILKRDTKNEVEIYGKWADQFIKGYPQFKGFIHYKDLDKKLTKTRYTLIIPIRPDWSTSKWAEMLALGVVPFMHPSYDTQYNVVPKDHFIRVKDPKDFYAKMKYLDENPEKRIALVKNLQYKLLKDSTKGTFIYDILNKSLERQKLYKKLSLEIDETKNRKTKSKSLF